MVRMSTPRSVRSPITSRSSSQVSPRPTMMPHLVSTSGSICLALARVVMAHSYLSWGCTFLKRRGTVSTLWPRISGRASMTILRASALPLKSGMSSSMEQPGCIWRTRRITSAKMGAPPSGRSSRLTEVMTTWRRFMALTAVATLNGSAKSRGNGRPVLMSQKAQLRVQMSPIIRKVAVPAPQHSPILGHCASSQTVCSSLLRISSFSRS
jgi:hypothetical protein